MAEKPLPRVNPYEILDAIQPRLSEEELAELRRKQQDRKQDRQPDPELRREHLDRVFGVTGDGVPIKALGGL